MLIVALVLIPVLLSGCSGYLSGNSPSLGQLSPVLGQFRGITDAILSGEFFLRPLQTELISHSDLFPYLLPERHSERR